MDNFSNKITVDDIVAHREMMESLYTTKVGEGRIVYAKNIMAEMIIFCRTFCREGDGDCPICKVGTIETSYLSYYNKTLYRCFTCGYIHSTEGKNIGL